MTLHRHLFIMLLVVTITGALVYGFLPNPVPVDTVTVSRGSLQVVIEEEGKTRVKDYFEISSPVAGTLCRLDWNVGDLVQAGQKLCEITPLKSVLLDPRSKADAVDRVAAAEALLRMSKANVMANTARADFADSEYLRFKHIYDKKLISRSQLERLETDKRLAKANLASSRYAEKSAGYSLEEARNALSHFASDSDNPTGERFFIHSPVMGRILAVYKESEGAVTAGQILLKIGNTQTLEVMVEVLSADAVRIQSGMAVIFDRWGGNHSLAGLVRVIEPVGFTKISALGVEEQRVRIIVDITSPRSQWERLGDGYRIETHFILWQGKDILQIPENALFRYDKSWAVFVANSNNQAELRKVKPGKRSGLRTQILEGLKKGEVVITHPDERIEDGRQIISNDP